MIAWTGLTRALVAAALGLTLSTARAAYNPPIGIPAPSFGIEEAADAATQTISGSLPSSITLAPGDVVVIAPGTYSSKMTIYGGGTAENPAYIRGASPSSMPVLTSYFEVVGAQYVILENLDFNGGSNGCIGIGGVSGAHHIGIRYCNFRNRAYLSHCSAIGMTPNYGHIISDIVIYRNNFSDLGDWQAETDQDFHGINPNLWGRDSTTSEYNIWVLDNYFYHVGGNGVQVNAGNWANSYLYLHHIYIGRNTSHSGRQAAFGSKQGSDIIMSQNKVYNNRIHGGQGGDGFAYQYGPHYLWIIFNEIWDCNFGVRQSDTGAEYAGHLSYVIGNVVYDSAQDDPPTYHWGSPTGWAVSFWSGSSTRYVLNNTFYDVHDGVEAVLNGPVTTANNITSTLKSGYPNGEPYRHYNYMHPARYGVASMDYELLYQPGRDIKGQWWDWGVFNTLAAFRTATGQCQHAVQADPQFLSVDSSDPRYLDLAPTSPAIDAADSTLIESVCDTFQSRYGVSIRYDFKGRPRPRGRGWDIGALEHPSPTVEGRHVFYNNSAFDGDNPAANADDDNAIAIDKAALLPGQTASFANYTSYSGGINGIMIDLAGDAGTPTASDFQFRVGNDANPAGWAELATTPTVSIRPGAGAMASTRICLTWPDGTIVGKWLQVKVLATPATGLTSPDVFYFGNAPGDTGDSSGNAEVTPADEVVVRNNPHVMATNAAAITDACDFDRDCRVSPTDAVIARNNGTNSTTALQLITVP